MQNQSMLVCDHKNCGKHYPADRHIEGKAAKVGKAHYCSHECAQEQREEMKSCNREQP